MKRTIKNIFSVAVLGISVASCSFLDVKPQVICSETFYNTEKEVQYGLYGVYGVMNKESLYGNMYSQMCSNVDDLSYFNRSNTTSYVQVYRHDATSTEIYKVWIELYRGIRNANAFMEAVQNSEFDKEGKYYNEARFLRAYYHFLLAQAWGDVPLRTVPVKSNKEVMIAATPQADVLRWVVSEMEACLALAPEELANAPSRVTKTAIQGILARVNLFMAGETVKCDNKKDYWKAAMDYADSVIASGQHRLNPDYKDVFIRMISDKYDTDYRESMWEVEFMGNRSTAENWSNGRIGDIIGLQSTGSKNFPSFNCNYAYGQYNGSVKLWDLYWAEDRTADETRLDKVTDSRQEWNMCPYNYSGNPKVPPYGSGLDQGSCRPSIDKTPYIGVGNVTTSQDPIVAPGVRNCGKYRREVIYEGVDDAKRIHTGINYPILRYSDILLMYAEASNEYNGMPTQKAYDCVKLVRDRAGVKTKPLSEYDNASFRQFVRNERGRELCFESLRKYDLIRWGIFVQEMNKYSVYGADERWFPHPTAHYAIAIGAAVIDKHIYLPVPSVELGVNNLLEQNPMW